MTLHKILNLVSGNVLGVEIDSKEWVDSYEKLIQIIYMVGVLTNHSTHDIIKTLDEIDSSC